MASHVFVHTELSKAIKEAKEANKGTVRMEKKLAKKGERFGSKYLLFLLYLLLCLCFWVISIMVCIFKL